MPNSAQNFRKWLKGFCDSSGGVSQVARETGINRSLLDKYLRGDSVPGLEQLDRLASAMAHHPAELIVDPEQKISVVALLEIRKHIEALARAAG